MSCSVHLIGRSFSQVFVSHEPACPFKRRVSHAARSFHPKGHLLHSSGGLVAWFQERLSQLGSALQLQLSSLHSPWQDCSLSPGKASRLVVWLQGLHRLCPLAQTCRGPTCLPAAVAALESQLLAKETPRYMRQTPTTADAVPQSCSFPAAAALLLASIPTIRSVGPRRHRLSTWYPSVS